MYDEKSSDRATLKELIDFQAKDGSFNLFKGWKVSAEARVDFGLVPTYLGAAILMREYLTPQSDLTRDLIIGLEERIKGAWGEDYTDEWRDLLKKIRPERRLYQAYGSNISSEQMLERCPSSTL